MFNDIFTGIIGANIPPINQIIGIGLFHLWSSPGVFILFQILLGLVNLILLQKLLDISHLSPKIKIIILGVYIFCPYLLIFNVYYAKDVLFGYLFSILSTSLILAYQKQQLKHPVFIFLFVIVNVLISTIRYNGPPLLVIFPILYFLLIKRSKYFLVVISLSFLGYFLVTKTLYSHFPITPYGQSLPYITAMHDIAGIINQNKYVFNQSELNFLSQILPLEYWKKYYQPDNLVFLYFHNIVDTEHRQDVQVNINFFDSHAHQFGQIYLHSIINNIPFIFNKHLNSFWKILTANDNFYQLSLNTPSFMDSVFPTPSNILLHPQNLMIIPQTIKSVINSFFHQAVTNQYFRSLTRPIICLCLIFLTTFFLFFRRQQKMIALTIIIPTIIYSLTFFLFPAEQTTRYMFFIYPLTFTAITIILSNNC